MIVSSFLTLLSMLVNLLVKSKNRGVYHAGDYDNKGTCEISEIT